MRELTAEQRELYARAMRRFHTQQAGRIAWLRYQSEELADRLEEALERGRAVRLAAGQASIELGGTGE